MDKEMLKNELHLAIVKGQFWQIKGIKLYLIQLQDIKLLLHVYNIVEVVKSFLCVNDHKKFFKNTAIKLVYFLN